MPAHRGFPVSGRKALLPSSCLWPLLRSRPRLAAWHEQQSLKAAFGWLLPPLVACCLPSACGRSECARKPSRRAPSPTWRWERRALPWWRWCNGRWRCRWRPVWRPGGRVWRSNCRHRYATLPPCCCSTGATITGTSRPIVSAGCGGCTLSTTATATWTPPPHCAFMPSIWAFRWRCGWRRCGCWASARARWRYGRASSSRRCCSTMPISSCPSMRRWRGC